jgi:hypothetical protein
MYLEQADTLQMAHFVSNRFDFAQFDIADPVRRSISEAVECTGPAHP